MKISVQKLPKSELEMKVEIPVEDFDSFIEKAVLELGKDLEIEGFRKGHAPKEIIKKKFGQQKILQTAAEMAIRENYLKAVSENKIEPLGQPKIEILKLASGNPLEFKATVPVLPQIKLPDYKKIASQVKKREVEVTPEEIAKLKTEKERMEKERMRSEILEKIVKESEIEAPEILIESEKKRQLENLKKQVPQMLGISFEDYLKRINKNETELLDSLWSEAQRRVKNSLILKAIEKKENIEAQDQEVKNEMEKILKNYPQTEDLDLERIKEYTKEVIKDEKTLQILENL